MIGIVLDKRKQVLTLRLERVPQFAGINATYFFYPVIQEFRI